jgi:hypothetical protein
MSDNKIENSKIVKLVDSLLVRQPYRTSEIKWEEYSAQGKNAKSGLLTVQKFNTMVRGWDVVF